MSPFESKLHKSDVEREFSFEKELNLETQYNRCFRSLNETGVLEILPDQEHLGILGINGEPYPIPEYRDVLESLNKHEFIKNKIHQGFTELQLTPHSQSH